MKPLALFPAIDLRGGQAVRLTQGDPQRQEVFGDDPAALANRFVAGGAARLHVVDLDGAFSGGSRQVDLLAAIAATGVPVQFGGGLRTEAEVEAAFAAGAARVVIGTRALDGAFLPDLLARFGPERVIAGLDARGEQLAVAGWARDGGITVVEAARQLRALGVREAVCTQVSRDGMLAGPDLTLVARVAECGLGVIASGGITTTADLRTLRAMDGVIGAIVGRALYAGRLPLADALAAAEGEG